MSHTGKVLVLSMLLFGCDTASQYDPDQGRFRDRSEMRQEQEYRIRDIERRLDEQEKNK